MQTILEDFYELKNYIKNEKGGYEADLKLNKNHEIFKGHFPGNPVTPGVCMMQIVKDLTEKFTEKKLFLKSASNVKFMAIINPEVNADLKMHLDITESEDSVKIKNTTFFGDTIALKMSANYQKTI